nr:hypothetical protein [Deinococcus sp.]
MLVTWDERYPDFYTLLGGAIQTEESAAAAARRECREFGFFFRVEPGRELPAVMLEGPHVTFRWLLLAPGQQIISPRCVPQLLRVPEG